MKSFDLDILTPDKVLFRGKATYLSAPGAAGFFGVLADHASMITPLKPGSFELWLDDKKTVKFNTAHNGLFEVHGNRVSVLLEAADSSVLTV